jgi:pantothenate kinase
MMIALLLALSLTSSMALVPSSWPSSSSSTSSSATLVQQTISTSDAGYVARLAQRAVDILHQSNENQVYIAIAGAPGSGKSYKAQLVCDFLNSNSFLTGVVASKDRDNSDDPNVEASDLAINTSTKRRLKSIVIPMDGYHILQADLRIMGQQGRLIGDAHDATAIENGSSTPTTFDDLMRRRGAPWTFDPTRLYTDLQRAKTLGNGSFPLYDRSISDPVPDQVHVKSEHAIVFCEGNYLLAFDDPAWQPLQSLWDDTWFIDASEHVLRQRLVSRHLATWTAAKEARFGLGRVGALAKIESSDLKNAQWVYQMSRHHAALIVSND